MEAKENALPPPSLGIYGKKSSPPDSDPALAVASALVMRFALQTAARRLLPLEGVSSCLRRRQSGKDFVDLWHLPEVGRAKYGGLQTCCSVWACPVCAAKITERRRLEVRQAIDAWALTQFGGALGGDVVLATFTVRHNSGDQLRPLVDGLVRSLGRISSGKMGGLMRSRYGVVGHIRSVEVTYGDDNGWHPHVHMLIFVKPCCKFDLLWLHLRNQWSNALRLEGMKDVTSRGVDLRWAKENVAEYVAKMGHERTWDIEHELSKGPVKAGREGHFSPVQLLAQFAEKPEETDQVTGEIVTSRPGRLWRVYADAMKGVHQLRFSNGLRALLGLRKEKTDEEIAEEKDKLGVLLARLDKKQWATVLHFDKRAELLSVAAAGDEFAVVGFLGDLEYQLVHSREDESRIVHSQTTYQRGFMGHDKTEVVEAEAAELGLSYSEYRLWAAGGMDAIAHSAPGAAASAPDLAVREAAPCNPASFKRFGRQLLERGRQRIRATERTWICLVAAPMADYGPEDDPLNAPVPSETPTYASNGYSQRFVGL